MQQFRFSIRSMLLLVAGIAALLGYWTSLAAFSPRWQDLLSRIEAAKTVPVRGGVHHGKLEAFSNWPQPTTSTYITAIALLVGFFISKRLIATKISKPEFQLFAYACAVSAVLPHIYLNWTSWYAVNIYFLGNWLASPVAFLAIPTCSLIYDARQKQPLSIGRYCLRSLLEAIVLTPIWSFVWSILLLFTGLVWI